MKHCFRAGEMKYLGRHLWMGLVLGVWLLDGNLYWIVQHISGRTTTANWHQAAWSYSWVGFSLGTSAFLASRPPRNIPDLWVWVWTWIVLPLLFGLGVLVWLFLAFLMLLAGIDC